MKQYFRNRIMLDYLFFCIGIYSGRLGSKEELSLKEILTEREARLFILITPRKSNKEIANRRVKQ
jgi:hypothetical protein